MPTIYECPYCGTENEDENYIIDCRDDCYEDYINENCNSCTYMLIPENQPDGTIRQITAFECPECQTTYASEDEADECARRCFRSENEPESVTNYYEDEEDYYEEYSPKENYKLDNMKSTATTQNEKHYCFGEEMIFVPYGTEIIKIPE